MNSFNLRAIERTTFIDLTITQVILCTRRLAFVIYVILLLALTGPVALDSSRSNMALVSSVSSVLIFFQLPLLALLISPLVVQHKGARQDWLWTTSLELPLLVLSQFVGVALVLSGTLALNGLLMFALLLLLGAVPIGSVVSLFGLYLLLVLPVTLMCVSVVIALALVIRHTLVVTAIAAGLSILTLDDLLMPAGTLLTPLHFTLTSLEINPVVGLGPDRPLLLALLAFYLGCIPFLLILATIGHARLDRRSGWSSKHRRSLAVLAFLALVGVGGSWQLYSVTAAQRLVPPPVAEQIDVWEVIRAEQRATLEQTHNLQVSARLLLHNQSSEGQGVVVLNVNPGLRVSAASAAGETVASQRLGETVQLGPLPSTVEAGREIELELLYTGTPILLREDYQLAGETSLPISFQKAYVSYVGANGLQWMRDSDWLAWPLALGPHVARERHSLQISLNRAEGPFWSSGSIREQTDGKIIYAWENPLLPQFLVAGGAYRHDAYAEGHTWVGKLSGEETVASAQWLLQMRYTLGEWLEAPPHASYQVVELPYIQDIALGGLILGFPNNIERRFKILIPVHESVTTAAGITDDILVDTPAGSSGLYLAIKVSRAWLSDQIHWPENRLSTAGTLQEYQELCGPPDDHEDPWAQEWECTRENLGGPNLQAPHGRWVEEAEWQSGVTPLLQAFAVVTAHELALLLTGDGVYIEEEQAEWKDLASHFLDNDQIFMSERESHRPVGSRNSCSLVYLVVSLSEFSAQFGREALADLIASLAQRHPPGSTPVTEEVVQRLAQDTFGYDWPLPRTTSCQEGNDSP